MDEPVSTHATSDVTHQPSSEGPAPPDPTAPTITLPKSVADQVTVVPGAAGASPDVGLSTPQFRARYGIGQELGHGGMGVVYAATDADLRRTVAMKVMQADVAGSRENAERFLREVQTTAQLEHPNIMPVYDVGLSDEGRLYYTMKLVRGKTLSTLLKEVRESRSGHSIPRLLEVFTQVCNGIAYAHAKGVLHRDIKPDNIMLGEHGEVVLMDWGLAKVLGTLEAPSSGDAVQVKAGETLSGTVIGTPAYMAPEQARGDSQSIGPHTDVYALGAILYELLALRAPYVGSTSKEILTKVLRGRPASPRLYNRSVPKALDAICRKAMAPDTGSRYATVDDLAEDVHCYLEGRPVTAHDETAWERVTRGARRNRKRIVLISIVAVASLLVMGSFRLAAMKRADAAARAFLVKANLARRGIRDPQAPLDLRMGAYSDARHLCDQALRASPNLPEAQRTRAEVIFDFAETAVERRQFDLAESLTLELETQIADWGDLQMRVRALSRRLDDERKIASSALNDVFARMRAGEIQITSTAEGLDAIPEAVESKVGTPRGRWSVDTCLAHLRNANEQSSVRALAALLLARYGAREESVFRALREGLAAGTPDSLLVACADALASLGDASSARPILDRLSDAITRQGSGQEDLLQVSAPTMLLGPSLSVSERLGAAVVRLGVQAAPDVEKVLLSSPDATSKRTFGYSLLARLGGEPGVRAVLKASSDAAVGGVMLAESLVRRLDAASVATSPPACAALLEGLSDARREVRYLCLLLVVGDLGEDPANRVFQFLIEQGNARMNLNRLPSLREVAWPSDVRKRAGEVAKEMMTDAKDRGLRRMALRALATAHTPDAERELVQHVNDEDADAVRLALFGLSDASPEVIPDLLVAASTATAEIRPALLQMGEAAIARLRWAWKPSRPTIPAEARKVILKGVKDGDVEERMLCAGAAGIFGVAEARTDLEAILAAKGDAALRRRAAWAIGRLGDPASLPGLLALLRDEKDAVVREGVALAVARYHRAECLPALQEALERHEYAASPNLRAAVGEVIGKDIAALMQMIARETHDAAWMSLATVLARVPGPEAGKALEKLEAGEKAPLRRLQVDVLLFERDDGLRIRPVARALSSEREEERTFAKETLSRWFHVDCGTDPARWEEWWDQNGARLRFDPEGETFVLVK